MDFKHKCDYYRCVVKMYLGYLQRIILIAKTEEERREYKDRYNNKLNDYSVLLGIQPKNIDRYITKYI